MQRQNEPMSKTPAKAYQPTERETATLAAYETRQQVSKASPRWKVTQNDDGHTEVASRPCGPQNGIEAAHGKPRNRLWRLRSGADGTNR